LYNTGWAINSNNSDYKLSNALNRPSTFACLANFESGSLDIDPSLLEHVFAMSSGNSIFVAAPLLCDPFEIPLDQEVRRVIGNIGRAGIAMLIPPQDTKIRKLDYGTWNLVNHTPYNGKSEDCFKSTSLHLSFTPYTQPINIGNHGLQDIEVFFIESVVSIHDRDKWVSDIDILGTFNSHRFHRHQDFEQCYHSGQEYAYGGLVCFDNWEELLDKEGISGVVRARDNWLARLAAAAVSVKLDYDTTILSSFVCWDCVDRQPKQRGVTFIC
jgi:hypothetical protein